MKKLLFTLTLAAFASAAALQAGEEKKTEKACDATKAKATTCADQAKSSCATAAKATCCEKEAFAKRITLSPKRTELALK